MNKVFLKSLKIKDFKGIKDLSIDFADVTNIAGDNGLGKTSIFDAFTWLLFDKDSKNRTAFDIKPLDPNNQIIRGLTPTVTGVFETGGRTIILSKTYKEKWSKKRGEAEATFTGNETLYEVNNIPVKKKDYIAEVGNMVDEEKFKLLSNPYFFSNSLNWKEARNIIFEIVGDINIEDIIKAEPRLEEIKEELLKDNIDMLLKSKKATVTKLSKEKKEIPVRINEIKNNYIDLDFEELEKEANKLETELQKVNEEIILATSEVNKVLEVNEEISLEISNLAAEKREIEEEERRNFYKKKYEFETTKQQVLHDIFTIQNNKQHEKSNIEEEERRIKTLKSEISTLREKYKSIQAEKPTLEELKKECPTCKREFDKQFVEEMQQQIVDNFNTQKAKRLQNINQEGTVLKANLLKCEEKKEKIQYNIKQYDEKLDGLNKELITIENNMKQFESDGQKDKVSQKELETLDIKIEKLKTKLKTTAGQADNLDQVNQMKETIFKKLSQVRSQLSQKDINKHLDSRMQDLLLTEKNLGCKIAQIEKQIMLCELYIRTRVKLLESSINAKFKYVSFKMFKEQINGALDETCEALVNGVPFGMANTASQINAGLDIIDTLSKYFEISTTIFIDNAESINNIIKIDSQLVKLIVSKDKKLIIKGE